MIQEDKDDTAVFCAAVGDTEMLLDFYSSRGQMSDAVLTAQVACEGLLPNMVNVTKQLEMCNGVDESSESKKQ